MGLTWPAGHRQARQLSRTGPSRQWALVLTSAAFFMVALDALVVITALAGFAVGERRAPEPMLPGLSLIHI